MNPVRMRWAPHPYRAAFALLDHTDGSETDEVLAAYRALDRAGVRATRTVWAFDPVEASGVPPLPDHVLAGVTLDQPQYRDLCASLARGGHELALHGASAGNNRRARTVAAFERLADLGGNPALYVCHAKNAENLYWQHRAFARGPLRWVSRALSGHRCSGEEPLSPYFWGDVCRERVRFIPLFRTAAIDTLAANPSLPYFELAKPYVNGWFTLTHRVLEEVATVEALASLAHDEGACLLRVHLASEVDPARATLRPVVERALRRLASAPGVWVAPAGEVLERLRRMQRVLIAWRDSDLWLLNLNPEPVESVQLEMGARARMQPGDARISVQYHGDFAVVDRLPPSSLSYFDCSAPLAVMDERAIALDELRRGMWDFGHGVLRINLGSDPWRLPHGTIRASTYELHYLPGMGLHAAFSAAPDAERLRLALGHAALKVRRVAREGERLRERRRRSAPRLVPRDATTSGER